VADDDKKDAGDLRKELNSLWKSTIDQFDEIKNVIVRSSGAGKAKLDSTFLKRQRDKLLTDLGTRLLQLSEAGELTLPEDLRSTANRVRELEREIEEQDGMVDRLLRPEDEEPATAPEPEAKAEAKQPPEPDPDDEGPEPTVEMTAETTEVAPPPSSAEAAEARGAAAQGEEDIGEAVTEPPRQADDEDDEGAKQG
jgi:hypothetical protein